MTRKVFQEERIHRAVEADMKLGNFSLGKGNDGDASELQMLVQRGDVGLIAAETVQASARTTVKLPLWASRPSGRIPGRRSMLAPEMAAS